MSRPPSSELFDDVTKAAESLYAQLFGGSPHPDAMMESTLRSTFVRGFRAGYIYSETNTVEGMADDQPSDQPS